jgi:hypothetical protein
MVKFLLTFFIFAITIFADVSFHLSKSKIKKGEPIYIQCEVTGSEDVQPTSKVFSSAGVIAEYVGTEESVSMVNFEVSRKKILRFRIVSSKDGNLETPVIKVKVGGKEIISNPMKFTVSKEAYQNPIADNDFSDFFEGSGFPNFPGLRSRKRNLVEPSKDDLKLIFETTRTNVYVGETIVAYFNLYYKNMEPPLLERNEARLLNFPFFSTQLLGDTVSIASSGLRTFDGDKYNQFPYQKEIYALTALKKGIYKLGEAEFVVEGAPETYFPAKAIKAKTGTLTVLDIPKPEPIGFSGEVGIYNVAIISTSNTYKVGEPVHITIKITGEGSGLLFKDPLENYCKLVACDVEISFLGSNKKRSFVKLSSGGYGFSSEIEFKYSIYPKKSGKLALGELKILFFNPITASYETASTDFPVFQINEKPILPEVIFEKDSKFYNYLIYFLFTCSAFYLVYIFRTPLIGFLNVKNITLKLTNKNPEELEKLELMIGNKRESVLKNYFLNKGVGKEEIEYIMKIKKKFGYTSLTEIYQKLDKHEKNRLTSIAVNITREVKI